MSEPVPPPAIDDRVAALLEQALVIGATDPPAGLARCEEAVALAIRLTDRLGEARSVVDCSWWLYRLGNYDGAARCAATGYRLAADLGDRLGMGMALNSMGLVEMDRSCFPEAAQHYLAAIELLRGGKDEVDPTYNLAYLYQRLGDHATALEHFLACYRLDQEWGDPEHAMTLAAIGESHLNLGEPSRALAYLEEAHAAAIASGDPRVELDVCLQLGRALRRQGEIELAREHLSTALALAERLAEPVYEKGALQALAELAEQANEFAVGEQAATRALDVARRLADRFGEAQALIGVARARLGAAESSEEPDADPLLQPLREAQAICDQLAVLPLTRDVEAALAAAHERLGDHRVALAHYKAFHAAERACLEEEGVQRARVLAARFETERAQTEAENHRRHSLELAAVNEALREAHTETSRLLDQVQEQTRLLQRETTEDPLTGLRNRRFLDRVLPSEWAQARANGGDLAVVVVDIDHFKQINDRRTHPVGDEVLRRLAALLTASVRPLDHVTRIGGEEFVLVLPGTTGAEAASVAERLRQAVETAAWWEIHPELAVTVSAGVSTARENFAPDQLLATADAHLYEAKRAGRNRVWFGPATLPELVVQTS